MFTSVLTAFTLASLAVARPLDNIGNAIINNNCGSEVTLWTTGVSQQGPWYLAANGGNYIEQFAGENVAIVLINGHIDDPNGKYADVPKTTFGYSYVNGVIWYDLDGNGFEGSKLVTNSADDTCTAIVFDNGVNPGGNWTQQCRANADITLTLCAA